MYICFFLNVCTTLNKQKELLTKHVWLVCHRRTLYDHCITEVRGQIMRLCSNQLATVGFKIHVLNQVPLKICNNSMETDSLKITCFFEHQVLHICNETPISISVTSYSYIYFSGFHWCTVWANLLPVTSDFVCTICPHEILKFRIRICSLEKQ